MNGHAVALRVEGLRKRFGSGVALDDVTLDFASGGFNTLLGPSGCGKTTLLRIVAGFTAPDAGRVHIGGRDRTRAPAWERRIGFVFQSHALWPHMTVLENVAYGLRLRRLPRGEAAARAERALGAMGLEGAGGRRADQLSGGQQQRVALARALVLEPDVLLLDEPLSSLDARLRADMRLQIRALQREAGITTVYVTHDQEEALEMSDRVAVMSRGRVEQVGRPEEVYRQPRSAAVAAFLGAVTLLEGEAQADGSLLVGGHRLRLALAAALAGRRVRVAIRPEDVEMHDQPAEGALPGVVRDCAYLGHSYRTVVALAVGIDVVASARAAVEPGRAVWVCARTGAVVPS